MLAGRQRLVEALALAFFNLDDPALVDLDVEPAEAQIPQVADQFAFGGRKFRRGGHVGRRWAWSSRMTAGAVMAG